MAENLAIPGDLDWAALSRYTGVKYGAVGRGDVSLVQISLEAPADFISQPRSLVLDGCPMFAPAYMGRKRIFQMLSLHARGFLLLAVVCFARVAEALEVAAPVFFGPCTRISCTGLHQRMRVRLSLRRAA
jgi:hypothetical protein